MTLKKLLTMGLAGTLLVGTIATSSAAELDYEWYAKQNPDVVAEVGDSPEALKLHYDMYGRKEARMANTKDVEAQLRRLFKVDEYAELYPDVKEFYGEDAEAMFQHYLSYGLLEARRPSEKVSQATATSLKKAVEKALTDAGVEATPGSMELVAVITGETETLVAAKPELTLDTAELEKVTAALEQVSTVVEKAVTETVAEVTNPKPVSAPSSGGNNDCPTINWTDVRTLAELNVAISNNSPSIRLLDSITVTEGDAVVVGADKEVQINFNGKTITYNKSDNAYHYALEVKNGGRAVLTGGTLKNTAAQGDALGVFSDSLVVLADNMVVNGKDLGVGVEDGGCLIVEKTATVISEGTDDDDYAIAVLKFNGGATKASSVTVKGTVVGPRGLSVNGDRDKNDSIVIDGGTVSANVGGGMYLAGKVKAEVKNNATVKGNGRGIEIRAGELEISDSTIENTNATWSGPIVNKDGTTMDGVALGVSEHSTHHDVTVTANNATFKTSSDVAVAAANGFSGGEPSAKVSVTLDRCTIDSSKQVRKSDHASVTVTGFSEVKKLDGTDFSSASGTTPTTPPTSGTGGNTETGDTTTGDTTTGGATTGGATGTEEPVS